MALKMKMSMKLSQQFRMTPQLQQALKLLQVARHDLETEVRQELNENPVLEEIVDTIEDKPAEKENETSPEIEALNETNWEAYIDSQFKPLQTPGAVKNRDDAAPNYENMVSNKQTLYDHLNWQINFGGFNDEEKNILSLLINYIDDNGYLKIPLEKIAEGEQISKNDLAEMLPFLQEFEPAGVGARNLQECLLIQARHIEEDTKDLVHLIKNHLPDLELRKYKVIAKAMKLDVDVIKDLCQIVLSMDPKPGRAFLSQDTQFITPDVYVRKIRDQYIVSLNEDGLPRLRVSNAYKNILKSQSTQQSDKDYVKGKMQSALWLIKALQQRQQSLYKVAQSIVTHQKNFLDQGPAQLKPLYLKQVASDVELHESTVSRITSNKYIHTPQGLFELRYFFNAAVKQHMGAGEALSIVALRTKLKSMIQNENPKKPFSDAALCEVLKKEGILVARRTLAKHREALKIRPASKRKQAS